MSCITRSVLRWGLIGGLALGGATLLIGPERVAMGLSQIRSKAQGVVDGCIDDPVALRSQLQALAEEYPDRIAEVRGEIAEVDQQIKQFDRDVDIANRVVAMTTDDLKELKTLVARAEAEAAQSVRPVSIRFEGVRFSVDEAYTEGHRINNVRQTYRDRLAHDEVQTKFLQEQKSRLAQILDKLETDYNTYQSQLWQLDRQIDSIQRNDRLIELTEQQQATLEGYEKFGKLNNLKQLEAKLAELRAKQEAQLQHLEKASINVQYEERAEYEMDAEEFGEDPFEEVEIKSDEPRSADRSVAFADPIVIESD